MEKRKEKVREFAKSVERRMELFVSESIERENKLDNNQEEETKITLDQNEDREIVCRKAIKDRKIVNFYSRKRDNIKKITDINPNATDLKEIDVEEASFLNPKERNIARIEIR